MKNWIKLANGDYEAKREQGEFRLFKVRIQGKERWKIRWWRYDHTDHFILGYRKTLKEAKEACEKTKRWGMVKVKTLLIQAAKEMGWKPLDETLEVLLSCFNHVESELSVDHFPILESEQVETDSGIVAFMDLKYHVIRFRAVYSCDLGKQQSYRLYPTYIKTKGGTLLVQYLRFTEQKKMDDYSDYELKYYNVLLAGTKAECCLSTGEYEDAEKYTAEYKRLIGELCGGRKL